MTKSKAYIIEYDHNGSQWAVMFKAANWQDAENRFRALSNNGRLIGELQESIPFNADLDSL